MSLLSSTDCRRRIHATLSLTFILLNCTRHVELGSDFHDSIENVGGAASNTGGAGGDASACVVRECEGSIKVCGDCHDNDGDGLIDEQDPECTGACDDAESTLNMDVQGQSDATCKLDCFFDGDNGSGNDDCHWSHRCDPLSLAPDFPPSTLSQCAYEPSTTVPGTTETCAQLQESQSNACRNTCLPITPPGCDCFGCCEYPRGSQNFIWLGSLTDGKSQCDSTTVLDPTRCHPCTPVLSCKNE
jgi:hypothetical protein